MEVIYTKANLDLYISKLKNLQKTIGFVPTMGALHDGHLSLVSASKKQNDYTVVSIFVNPTQFNDKNDLSRYPRVPEKDLKILDSSGCDIVFMPDEKEVYPEPDIRMFDFEGLDGIMEGKHRPGHFNGVAQVVTRLFDMVKPDKAYFGLKDLQQLTIIKNIVRKLNYQVKIIACPIIREPDGLAMSSRNVLLNSEERIESLALSKALFEAKGMKKTHNPSEIVSYIIQKLNSSPGVIPEYFEIVDGKTLKPIENWNDSIEVFGCVAAKVGKVRLIDNINFSS